MPDLAERIWQRALKIKLPGHDAKLQFDGDDEESEPEELEQVPLSVPEHKEAALPRFSDLLKARGYPAGTVRKRKDGEYVKQPDGTWKRKPKGEARRKASEEREVEQTLLSTVADKLFDDGPEVSVEIDKKHSAYKTLEEWRKHSPIGRKLRHMELEDFARVVGAPPGSQVQLDLGAAETYVNVEHTGHGLEATRVMMLDLSTGEPMIDNEFFAIDHSEEKGLGTRVFSSQVHHARKLGFSYIEVNAAGEATSTFNGYYTWARLGYLPDKGYVGVMNGSWGRLQSEVRRGEITAPPGMRIDKTGVLKAIPQLMRTARGRKWWLKNGFNWWGKFDLKDAEGHSMRILGEYAVMEKSHMWKGEKPAPPKRKDGRAEELELTEHEERLLDQAWARVYPPDEEAE